MKYINDDENDFLKDLVDSVEEEIDMFNDPELLRFAAYECSEERVKAIHTVYVAGMKKTLDMFKRHIESYRLKECSDDRK